MKNDAEICKKPKKSKITGLDDGVLIEVTQRRTKPRCICAPDYMLGIYDVLRRRRPRKFLFFGNPQFLLGQKNL